MPVVCDFTRIVGDAVRDIGNAAVEMTFGTGGREAGEDALLIFSVRGLNNNVPVLVNNVNVGALTPNPTQNHWYTQMVYLPGTNLISGNNELQLEAVNNDPFQIRQVTCFFHQAA